MSSANKEIQCLYQPIYDENRILLNGGGLLTGHEGAIEVMSSSYGVSQPVDASTGRMGGVRHVRCSLSADLQPS